jgi:hypothetical protein
MFGFTLVVVLEVGKICQYTIMNIAVGHVRGVSVGEKTPTLLSIYKSSFGIIT